MEKEIIEEIMKKYESDLQNLENTVETNKINLHIKRLEEQREELNPISEKSLYEEYNRQIEEAKKELEVTPEDKKKKEIEKNNLKDATIFILTKANMEIDDKLRTADLDFQIELNKMHNFKYQYDENHIALNGNEFKAINDKIEEIKITLDDLREAKKICEKSLEELKQPSKEVEVINSILNGSYDREENSDIRPATEEDLEVEEVKKLDQEKNDQIITDIVNEELENKDIESKTDESDIRPATEADLELKENNKIEKTPTQMVDDEIKKTSNPERVSALNAMREIATEKEEKNNSEIRKASKDVNEKNIANKLKEKREIAQKNVIEVVIEPKKFNINLEKNEMIKYITEDGNEHKDEGATYKYGELKDDIIKEALKVTYSEKDEYKNEIENYDKYKKADPNIVNLLKYNKEKLERYIAKLNGEVIENNNENENGDKLNIEYNIKGLSKLDFSDEVKKEIEDIAFNHRNIAKVKSNIFQKIKFAFRGFKETIEKSRKTKMITDGIKTSPVKDEGISNEAKENNINSMDKYRISDEEKAKIDEKAYEWLDKNKEIKNDPEYKKMIDAGRNIE